MINGQPITLFLSCKVLFTLHVLIGIFFRGIPYLLQRGVDSLSHTAQCQWAASVDLLPCCKKSYSCGEAHFRSGLFVTQYRICVHTLDCHLRAAKKQQARRSSARGKLESEKVGLPWAWPGVLEPYDPCFNQIHARNNIIKHSNNVSFH